MEPTPQPESPEIKPGHQTTEAGAAGIAGLAALIPIIQSVLTKQGDTRVEVICLTVVACVYIGCRTWLKGRA